MPYLNESDYKKLHNDVVISQQAEDKAKLDATKVIEQNKKLKEQLANLIGHARWVAANFDVHYGLLDEAVEVFNARS